ncbi:hypothetical protein C7078_001364 [Salmonella enterica]|uniref:Uncharacterized protein n=2 Tax=Salmonella enterica TaxID=28901 RepID=A0A702G944_SALDZ|nr:hypothetical protein [Salmonella enterica]ECI0840322.1 hypothetical protein [Salmonella enterica subsp. diarizonae]EBO4170755.1 hypothetical protein [Salmonella enterica]ECI4240297.1 hypothetical protein [Salmonella enterica subsp. diarizonae]ECI5662366.1 hypothetical protein [Salmonella enterica subsp. diarizonae]
MSHMESKPLISNIIVSASLLFFSCLTFASTEKCNNLNEQEIISQISTDFLNNRASAWSANLMGNIGTKKPELVFSKNTIINKEIYGIPFEAIGPKNKTNFIGLYDCRTGKIEYSKE